ncbi:uncharacterized protein LOC134228083 [Armigeres subalbatus]|uniref:uncharacterized protein LOC134228083 n=1 Tax=Armigeres subalbatus TaxID=124917 RepID=UPI002ED5C168
MVKLSEAQPHAFFLKDCHVYETETTKLEKTIDQMVDFAWDDEKEADVLLAHFIKRLKTGNYVYPEDDLRDILKNTAALSPSCIRGYKEKNLHCQEIRNRLSILLNYGLAELQCNKKPNEQQMFTILNQLEPFVEIFATDPTWNIFFQGLWDFSINAGKSKLTAKMVTVYPGKINQSLEALLKSKPTDVNSLLDNENFIGVASIITIPEVFQHVFMYLARQDTIYPAEAHILQTSFHKTLKSNLPKSKLLALYPHTIRSFATILYETNDPNDQFISALLQQIKKQNILDFIILVTHFPLFIHLK